MAVRSLLFLFAAVVATTSAADEYDEAVADIMAQFDVNKDGHLDVAEAAEWIKQEIYAEQMEELDEATKEEFDSLSGEDHQQIVLDLLEESDADKDGRFSPEELYNIISSPVYEDEDHFQE